MKCKFISILCIVSALLTLPGCSKDDSGGGNTHDTIDYIRNYSFEYNNMPSLENWTSDQGFAVEMSNSTPPGGGTWSVMFETVWGPQRYLKNTVVGPQGNVIFLYSVWAKAEGLGGKAEFFIVHQDILTVRKLFEITDTTWSRLIALDTLALASGDSIGVRVSGAVNQLLAGKTWFDLARIEKIP
jgi:hypothetical protein